MGITLESHGMADTRENWDRLVLRLPKGLKDEVDAVATDQCRSLNGQLTHFIMSGVAAAKTASVPTA